MACGRLGGERVLRLCEMVYELLACLLEPGEADLLWVRLCCRV